MPDPWPKLYRTRGTRRKIPMNTYTTVGMPVIIWTVFFMTEAGNFGAMLQIRAAVPKLKGNPQRRDRADMASDPNIMGKIP
jgi:hypothetical protein